MFPWYIVNSAQCQMSNSTPCIMNIPCLMRLLCVLMPRPRLALASPSTIKSIAVLHSHLVLISCHPAPLGPSSTSAVTAVVGTVGVERVHHPALLPSALAQLEEVLCRRPLQIP